MPFLGSALTFMIVYVWSRRNMYTPMSFLTFQFRAPYLPWVLFFFQYIWGNDVKSDILGIAVGHIYYFCEFIYPRMTAPYAIRLTKTPEWFLLLFNGEAAINHAPTDNMAEDIHVPPQ